MKTVQTGSNFTVKASENNVFISIVQPSNTTAPHTYTLGTITTDYRPRGNIAAPLSSISSSEGNTFGWIKCSTSGTLEVIIQKSTYSSSGGLTLYGSLNYSI